MGQVWMRGLSGRAKIMICFGENKYSATEGAEYAGSPSEGKVLKSTPTKERNSQYPELIAESILKCLFNLTH
jgi:hypothetical protein